MSASNTEILFALGLDDEIVGVTQFCSYPPAATRKSHVGGFAAESFSLETIAALEPDLVLAAGSFHQPVIESLEKLGIPVAAFDAPSFHEVYENIAKIGHLTGRIDQAQAIVEGMKSKLDRVTERVRQKPRPTVLYLVSDAPLMSAGPGTVIHEALGLAGGTNVFADAVGQYPRISDEQLLRRNPTVVLFPKYGHDGKTQPPKVLEGLTAVKEKRLYEVNADLISRQTPRLIDAVEQIAELLHPSR